MTVIRPLAHRRRRQLIIARAECFRATLPPRKPPWSRSRLSRLSRIYRVAAFAQSLSRDHLGSSWDHLKSSLLPFTYLWKSDTHNDRDSHLYKRAASCRRHRHRVPWTRLCGVAVTATAVAVSCDSHRFAHTLWRTVAISPLGQRRGWGRWHDAGAGMSGDEDWAQLAVIHTGTRGTSYMFSGHWCSPMIFREAMWRATCRNGYQCTRMSFFFFPFLYCSRVPSRRADDYGYLL